jgi:hypothetical protein
MEKYDKYNLKNNQILLKNGRINAEYDIFNSSIINKRLSQSDDSIIFE